MYGYNPYTPGRVLFMLLMAWASGALIFHVIIADNLEGIVGDFRKDQGVAAYVVLWMSVDMWLVRRQVKQYRRDVQESLDFLEQQEKKDDPSPKN